MKKYLLVLLVLLVNFTLHGQGLYNNGAKIVVGAGTCLYITGNYQNETNVNNGSVDLAGTIKLNGNYINNVSTADAITTATAGSEVVFNGTGNQQVSGTTSVAAVFPKLTINKASNTVTFLRDALVNDSLKLINGLIDIQNNNFTFGTTASVGGNPSGSSMIVATGSGQVRKLFQSTGSFLFPVGDFNLIGEYSPVSLNFTSGTFASGAYAGLNLANIKYNDPAIAGSYLNRYWTLSQTGISGFTCDADFQYLSSDVVGTEAGINTLRVDILPFTVYNPSNTTLHQLSANGLTSFGVFTGGPGSILAKTLNLKLYVEGFYAGGGLMNQAQGSAGNQFPGNTVDKLTIELHDPVTYQTLVYSAPNIDLNTGGNASVSIPGIYNSSYYVTVKLRNSIETVTSAPLSFSSSSVNYDFTTAATQAFGSNLKTIAPGVFGIYSGDENQDGVVDVFDLNDVQNASILFSTGYLITDINGDGVVDIFDLIIVQNNSAMFVSKITP